MRFFILTKQKLAIITFCALAIVITAGISIRGITAVTASASASKKIPIYYVQKEEKLVSLSFDAAWGNEQTQELLDILDKYNIKTTFFLVGSWVDKYPESVKAICDAGHDVSNHSDTHPHMSKMPKEKIRAEIENCNNKIEALIGVKPNLFRPPYGDYNNTVVETVNELNMYCMQWNIDSLDWKDPSPEQIKKNIMSKIKPGSIILMHNGAKNTPAALPMVIEAITGEGYNIVPMSQIIYQCPYTTDHEGKQCPNS